MRREMVGGHSHERGKETEQWHNKISRDDARKTKDKSIG